MNDFNYPVYMYTTVHKEEKLCGILALLAKYCVLRAHWSKDVT